MPALSKHPMAPNPCCPQAWYRLAAADGSARVQSQGRTLPVDDAARTAKELAASMVIAPSDVSSGFAILDRAMRGFGLFAFPGRGGRAWAGLSAPLDSERIATPWRENG
jgi:hypothetical protein